LISLDFELTQMYNALRYFSLARLHRDSGGDEDFCKMCQAEMNKRIIKYFQSQKE